jgi:hypothetical protein
MAGSNHLHNLSSLTFCHVEWEGACDVLCEQLVRTRMLRQLRGLKTLSLDCVTDRGIRTLARRPELGGLRELSLAYSGDLSGEGVERLREGVELGSLLPWTLGWQTDKNQRSVVTVGTAARLLRKKGALRPGRSESARRVETARSLVR